MKKISDWIKAEVELVGVTRFVFMFLGACLCLAGLIDLLKAVF